MVSRRVMGLAVLMAAGFAGQPAASLAQTTEQSPRVVVVVHASVPVENLSMIELREIILGQRRFWPNGERIELVVEASASPARQAFVEKISGMTEAKFQHYWTSLIFSHKATRPPRNAPDRRLALALVNAVPGALALVEEGALPDNVKVISVDGQFAGASGYPF